MALSETIRKREQVDPLIRDADGRRALAAARRRGPRPAKLRSSKVLARGVPSRRKAERDEQHFIARRREQSARADHDRHHVIERSVELHKRMRLSAMPCPQALLTCDFLQAYIGNAVKQQRNPSHTKTKRHQQLNHRVPVRRI